MEINHICKQIELAKENKADAFENLLNEFSPLFKKYAFYLEYDDAFYDIQLDFIELILKINIYDFWNKPGQYILSYIKKSMYHAYIKESKKAEEYRCAQVDLRGAMEDPEAFMDTLNPTHDEYTALLITDLKKSLSDKEFQVIYNHYFLQYSISEISIKIHISRQTVNKVKMTALKKLKKEVK